jgi:hypothetical protein
MEDKLRGWGDMEQASSDREPVVEGTLLNPVMYLTHKDEPMDKYLVYLAHGTKPDKRGHNPRNFFDDINRLDKKYLFAMRKFIRTKGLPSQTHKNT